MLVVGIDPSLSSTGVCIYDTSDDASPCICAEIKSTTAKGHHGQRCEDIADAVLNFLQTNDLQDEEAFVFIEEPMNLQGHAQDLRALFWYIINGLEYHCPAMEFYAVPPNTLYKFLTGKGQTRAVNKVVAVQKKYGHLIPPEFVVDYDTPGGIEKHADVYDSIGLAALGECRLGEGEYSKAQVEAVKKVVRL